MSDRSKGEETNTRTAIVGWLTLALFCAIAPFANFYVQIWCSLVLMPIVPSTRVLAYISLGLMDATGAGITALVLTTPLAYLPKPRPLVWASLVTASAIVTSICLWQGSFVNTAAVITFLELLLLFLFCWAFGKLFERLRTRPKAVFPHR